MSILGRICSFVLKWVEVCCVKWVKVFTSGGWLERNLGGLNTSISNQRLLSPLNFNLRTWKEGGYRKCVIRWKVVFGTCQGLDSARRWDLVVWRRPLAELQSEGRWWHTSLCCDESCRMTAGGSFRKKRPVGGISWCLSEARRAILCRPTA